MLAKLNEAVTTVAEWVHNREITVIPALTSTPATRQIALVACRPPMSPI
jgi:hypothetical protein